jgi:hypothetical protein
MMTSQQRFRSALPYLLIVIISLTCNVARAADQIIPASAQLAFDNGEVVGAGVLTIHSTSGQRLYDLWLDPDQDVAGNVAVVSLTLSRTGHRDEDDNLLNPHGWFGLQRWDFAAMDLKNGTQKAAYGVERQIPQPALGLLVACNSEFVRESVSKAHGQKDFDESPTTESTVTGH